VLTLQGNTHSAGRPHTAGSASNDIGGGHRRFVGDTGGGKRRSAGDTGGGRRSVGDTGGGQRRSAGDTGGGQRRFAGASAPRAFSRDSTSLSPRGSARATVPAGGNAREHILTKSNPRPAIPAGGVSHPKEPIPAGGVSHPREPIPAGGGGVRIPAGGVSHAREPIQVGGGGVRRTVPASPYSHLSDAAVATAGGPRGGPAASAVPGHLSCDARGLLVVGLLRRGMLG